MSLKTISGSFSAVGTGPEILARGDEGITYTITGTFVATLVIEKAVGGGPDWVVAATLTTTAAAVKIGGAGRYRIRCSARTSGTASFSIQETDEVIRRYVDKDGSDLLVINRSGAQITALDNTPIGQTTPVAVSSTDLVASKTLSLAAAETGLTAHSGGGQASALALSASKIVHVVSTIGADNDSVKLPAAAVGLTHVIQNAHATKSLQVFGQATETINGVASATGVAVAAGKSAVFIGTAAGLWLMVLSA